jgi:hypothetical protein
MTKTEQLSVGRSFPLRERISFSIRGEFFNVFNRVQLGGPTSGNPFQTQSRDQNGVPISGFGRIDPQSAGTPRNGQIVARLRF